MSKHDTVGQCLVNHCGNNVRARPCFLRLLATGKLEVDVLEGVVSGLAKACKKIIAH